MSIFLRQSFRTLMIRASLVFVLLPIASLSRPAKAQENRAPAQSPNDSSANLSEQVTQLRTLVEQLQKQISDLLASAQLSFNGSLKGDFQGSYVISDGDLI